MADTLLDHVHLRFSLMIAIGLTFFFEIIPLLIYLVNFFFNPEFISNRSDDLLDHAIETVEKESSHLQVFADEYKHLEALVNLSRINIAYLLGFVTYLRSIIGIMGAHLQSKTLCALSIMAVILSAMFFPLRVLFIADDLWTCLYWVLNLAVIIETLLYIVALYEKQKTGLNPSIRMVA